MAMNTNRVDFDVNFNVNKTSYSNLTKSLEDVQKIVNSKAKGKSGLTEELKEAQSAATQLKSILNLDIKSKPWSINSPNYQNQFLSNVLANPSNQFLEVSKLLAS